jgi:putative transposase
MRGPKPPVVKLSEAERQALEQFVRRHGTPQQLAWRARIVLLAADGLNNEQITRRLGIGLEMVRRWRMRWLALPAATLVELPVADRLSDAPRPGAPASITPEQVCRIVALACEAPKDTGRPISQWTGREIADAIQQRGIVETISARHAARLLKRGTLSRI